MDDDFIDDLDEYLAHHGIKGMHWGIWNAETAARYAGKVKRAIKRKTKAISKHHKENKEKKKQEKIAEKEAKREQEEFDKYTRKKYHLSGSEYKKLRNMTLSSNDPSVVKRGMHLLTDEELASKIARLNKEDQIRRLANEKETKEAAIKNTLAAAKQRKLSYQLANTAGTMAINVVRDSLLKPGAEEIFKRTINSVDKSIAKQEEKRKKAEQKAEERKANAEERKVKSEAKKQLKQVEAQEKKRQKRIERSEAAAEDTRNLIEYAKQQGWYESPNLDQEERFDLKQNVYNRGYVNPTYKIDSDELQRILDKKRKTQS